MKYNLKGTIEIKSEVYGHSVDGTPLLVFESEGDDSGMLILGAMHGDESSTTILLSEALRSLGNETLKTSVVLAVNPDGVALGTRGNANGVDLNRNYPTQNWQNEPVYYKNQVGEKATIELSTGDKPGSEPETKALIQLIKKLNPKIIITLHGYLDCIDDPELSPLAKWISKGTGLKLIPDVGYSTPGSFGSWCKEQNISVITYEFANESLSELRQKHFSLLRRILLNDVPEQLLQENRVL